MNVFRVTQRDWDYKVSMVSGPFLLNTVSWSNKTVYCQHSKPFKQYGPQQSLNCEVDLFNSCIEVILEYCKVDELVDPNYELKKPR